MSPKPASSAAWLIFGDEKESFLQHHRYSEKENNTGYKLLVEEVHVYVRKWDFLSIYKHQPHHLPLKSLLKGKSVRMPMMEKEWRSVLGAQSQLQLLPEPDQNLKPNYLVLVKL